MNSIFFVKLVLTQFTLFFQLPEPEPRTVPQDELFDEDLLSSSFLNSQKGSELPDLDDDEALIDEGSSSDDESSDEVSHLFESFQSNAILNDNILQDHEMMEKFVGLHTRKRTNNNVRSNSDAEILQQPSTVRKFIDCLVNKELIFFSLQSLVEESPSKRMKDEQTSDSANSSSSSNDSPIQPKNGDNSMLKFVCDIDFRSTDNNK